MPSNFLYYKKKKRGVCMSRDATMTEVKQFRAIHKIFLENGAAAITYGNIAAECGVTRGCVQGIFRSNDFMFESLEQVIKRELRKRIIKNDDLLEQWPELLKDREFAHCIKYLLDGHKRSASVRASIARCITYINKHVEEELLYRLLGAAAVLFLLEEYNQ